MRKLIVLTLFVVSALAVVGCAKEEAADMTPPKGADAVAPATASPGGAPAAQGGGTPSAAPPATE